MILLAAITFILATVGAVTAFALSGDGDGTPGEDVADQLPPDWQLVEALGWPNRQAGFSLWLPPGWQLKELQGVDSYVGEIVGDGVHLTYDLGWYSSPLADDDDPQHVVTYAEIGGLLGKLVQPREGTDGTLTGVYFESFDGAETAPSMPETRLQVSGVGLTPEQQETAVTIFETIRIVASEPVDQHTEHPGDGEPAATGDEPGFIHRDPYPIQAYDCGDGEGEGTGSSGIPCSARVDGGEPIIPDETGMPEPPPDTDDLDPAKPIVEVWAPIDEVEVSIMESFPPQYGVRVVSGLPSGCVEFGGISWEQDGDTIRVEVFNLEPAEAMVCTAIYGMVENNLNLGSDFQPGRTYTVVVNGDVAETFLAQ